MRRSPRPTARASSTRTAARSRTSGFRSRRRSARPHGGHPRAPRTHARGRRGARASCRGSGARGRSRASPSRPRSPRSARGLGRPSRSPSVTRARPMLLSACARISSSPSASAMTSASRPSRIASSDSYAAARKRESVLRTYAFCLDDGSSASRSTARSRRANASARSPCRNASSASSTSASAATSRSPDSSRRPRAASSSSPPPPSARKRATPSRKRTCGSSASCSGHSASARS